MCIVVNYKKKLKPSLSQHPEMTTVNIFVHPLLDLSLSISMYVFVFFVFLPKQDHTIHTVFHSVLFFNYLHFSCSVNLYFN